MACIIADPVRVPQVQKAFVFLRHTGFITFKNTYTSMQVPSFLAVIKIFACKESGVFPDFLMVRVGDGISLIILQARDLDLSVSKPEGEVTEDRHLKFRVLNGIYPWLFLLLV